MAKWSFAVGTITPGAGTADATNLTASTYMALQGGSTTQLINIEEVYMGGQHTASAPLIMLLARDSTVVATPTALSTPNSNGALHPATAALAAVPVGAITGGTQAQRSNSVTHAKLNLTFNAFGGIVRWVAAPDEYFSILGNTASLGEASLSSFTGSTASAPIGAHIVYKPM